jgi:hypothetical protein
VNAKTTISHYSGTGVTPAWTETEGNCTRNITGITAGLAATQINSGEATIQLVNLHGDVVGTVPDNSGAEFATLTSESTAYGVPATTGSKNAWLGAEGFQTEFEASGIVNTGTGIYVPQLGIYLESAGLSGAAAQDPVNEYLADETLAQPSSYGTSTSPGAIEPLPVNEKLEKEWHEHPAWNAPPVNTVDPSIFLTSAQAKLLAYGLRNGGKALEVAISRIGGISVIVSTIVKLGQTIANELAEGLEDCYSSINQINANARCKLFINLFGIVPTSWGVETCFAKAYKRRNKIHYTYPYCTKT